MSSEMAVRLRDQRKPKHGWYDNEIYDVFGDELGQHGISVYMALTRLCYGETVCHDGGAPYSVRELAEHARMKKDTFHRNLKRVIAMGLVVERKGATAQSASFYDLVDVKELAARALRDAVNAAKAKSVSPRDTRPAPTLAQLVSNRMKERADEVSGDERKCLTQRQQDKKNCAAESATEVSQNCTDFETEVSQDGRHLRQDSRPQDPRQVLPPAPQGGKLRAVEGDDRGEKQIPCGDDKQKSDRESGGDGLSGEEREELEDINAMRARMQPPLGPLTWEQYAPARNLTPTRGAAGPSRRERRRRFVPQGVVPRDFGVNSP